MQAYNAIQHTVQRNIELGVAGGAPERSLVHIKKETLLFIIKIYFPGISFSSTTSTLIKSDF